ncbi:hypothetical protein QO002_005502 [Pararhizobium capsulatum DSM 1112]|uniref:Coenzyme PQQ synthesis protein A n=1 Tax=Pararhizobium capsulatum DSM 1112 TaxID=1121113 RepID=A0ABU0BYF8_9HYPH|nr:hypothetical protein [Pararhizobium capsulatum DSM 1112]
MNIPGVGYGAIARMMGMAEMALCEEELMKKTWTKPAMCTVAVGMEMSRYFPAQLPAKK